MKQEFPPEAQLSLFRLQSVGIGPEFLRCFYVGVSSLFAEAEWLKRVVNFAEIVWQRIAQRDGFRGEIAKVLRPSIDLQNYRARIDLFLAVASNGQELGDFLYELLARFASILARTSGFVASVDHPVQSRAGSNFW